MKGLKQLQRSLVTALAVILAAILRTAAAGGDPDPTFGAAGKVMASTGYAAEIYATKVQSDGKIVVVGHHEQPGETGLIARFNPDGSFDQTFGTGGIVTVTAHLGTGGHVTYFMAVAIQPDGKIIASGHFLESGGCGIERAFVVRLNTDGSLDAGFANNGTLEIIYECVGTTAVSFANAIAIQANGKIVIAGSARKEVFPEYSRDFAVSRLNANGTFDTSFSGDGMATFAVGSEDDEAFGVAVNPVSGKILLAGYSINPSGNKDFALLQVQQSGSIDTSFGFFGYVRTDFAGKTDQINSVLIQPDGKILAGGVATAAPLDLPDARFGLARYSSTGALDSTFGFGGKVTTNFTNWSDSISSIALQTDGKIVAAGSAVTPGGTYSNFAVARYLSNGAVDTSFSGDGKLTTDFVGGADFGRGLAIQSDGKILVVGYAGSGSTTHIAMSRYQP